MKTLEERNTYQRAKRLQNGNSYTHKYEKTVNGFLMRKYRNMETRVTGVQKLKYHLYKGLSILPKEDFYNWSKDNQDFWNLFKTWGENNYERRLCPSVDRINPKLGYELKNMRWITHGENSRLGAINRNKKTP